MNLPQVPIFPQIPQLNWDLLLSWQSWALIVIFVGVLAMAIWRRVAPGFPGSARGVYTLTSFYSGRYFDDVTGNLVDITNYVLAPQHQRAFLAYVAKQLPSFTKFLTAKAGVGNPSDNQAGSEKQDEAQRLLELVKDSNFSLSSFGNIRLVVIGVRTIIARHVFLTFVDARKSFPTDYIAEREHASVNILTLDWVNRGLMNGHDYELPEVWQIPDIGKVHVHIYFPIPIEGENIVSVDLQTLKDVGKLSLFARFTWEGKDALDEKDRIITEKEVEIKDLRRQIGALSTALDAALKSVSGWSSEKKRSFIAQFEKQAHQIDVYLYVMATIFGGLAAQFLHYDTLFGSVASLVAVAIVRMIWRR